MLLSEKAMATHSSTLAWKVPWTEQPGGLQSMGSLRVGTTEWLHFRSSLSGTGEGNGTPLQYSCLKNPRDGGAWWASVYGVAQSRTRLRRLSSSSKPSRFSVSRLLLCIFFTFSSQAFYSILHQIWPMMLLELLEYLILFFTFKIPRQ